METSSKASAGRTKQCVPAPSRGRLMSDSASLPSYAEYPAGRPFINTALPLRSRAVKAFPESSSAAILSALRNLQEKIRTLELERRDAQLKLRSFSRESTQETDERDDDDTHKNHDLLSQLSVAEARCSRLEKQLSHMRTTVRATESDRTTPAQPQVSVERPAFADPADVRVKLRKLDVLEQEYQRLTETQSATERKIRQLEQKLTEEQHQRKLVQDTAAQLQTGLEANRLLIQSVSPRPQKSSRVKAKKHPVKKHSSSPPPHYRLSLRDVPFVTGTATGSSHSVRANVQRVLHQLKQHQPQLCNARVLGHAPSHSDSSSSSSCGEELAELLLTLQDEFGRMSFEQQGLSQRMQCCSSSRVREDLECEMASLLQRMESKEQQIDKVRRHQTQMVKLRRRCGKGSGVCDVDLVRSSSSRVKPRPGEGSRDSLRLLKDMRSLQSSLHNWEH